ncbi:cytochrome c [Azospirillum sp. CT11-132]|nr:MULTISPECIES: cytochrome c [unclassified Azospirillum]
MHPTLSGGQLFARIVAAAGIAALCSPALAQSRSEKTMEKADEPIGQSSYFANCAVCHGRSGHGDGPYADYLTRKPANLTTIRERNKGVFPLEYLYGMIDGREGIGAHGPREMPVWGSAFRAESVQDFWPWGSEQVVRGKILELVYYIQTIQDK